MSLARFDPTAPDIRVWVRLLGPRGFVWCEGIMDTGASRTVFDESVLIRLGYDLTEAETIFVATPMGASEVRLIVAQRVDALGISVRNFPIIAMPLLVPLRTEVLLGLDFLRQRNLFCNFAKGILLTLPFAQNFFHRLTLMARLFAKL